MEELRIPWKSIDIATNHFSDKKKRAEGIFGDIYECELLLPPLSPQQFGGEDTSTTTGAAGAKKLISGKSSLLSPHKSTVSTHVAVKKLRTEESKNFTAEIELLLKYRHRNIVSLRGFAENDTAAAAGGEKCLVFEWLNEVLEQRLLRRDFPWSGRLKAMVGVARALMYLQTFDVNPTYHCDVKTSKIALDGDGYAKLFHFGVSSRSLHKGTSGYMCPAFAQSGQFTSASEIFSFGVVLLELFTGRPAIGEDGSLLYIVCKRVYKKHASLSAAASELVDARVSDWPLECAEQLLRVALHCTEEDPEDRPSVMSVWQSLSLMKRQYMAPDTASRVDSGEFTYESTQTKQGLLSCCICQEGASFHRGLSCEQGHFVCGDCADGYVLSQSEPIPLADQCGAIVCPKRLEYENYRAAPANRRPICTAPAYTPSALRAKLHSITFDTYVTRLVGALQRKALLDDDHLSSNSTSAASASAVGGEGGGGDGAEGHVDDVVARVVGRRGHDGVLSINCPSCNHVEDPAPDGCRAVRCSYCACHFCWICLHAFDYDAHLHFGHGGGPPDGSVIAHGRQLFMPDMHPELILAHRQYRFQKIKLLLENETPEVQRAVIDKLNKELKDYGLIGPLEKHFFQVEEAVEEVSADPFVREKEVLMVLYRVTQGNKWSRDMSWGSAHKTNPWYGVKLSPEGHVTKVQLMGNNLNGVLPGELRGLTMLTSLSLYDNRLSGEIPKELSELTNLRELSLNNNAFSGTIPSEFSTLTNLTLLNLAANRLSGVYPRQLSNLIRLDNLLLYGNDLQSNKKDVQAIMKRCKTIAI